MLVVFHARLPGKPKGLMYTVELAAQNRDSEPKMGEIVPISPHQMLINDLPNIGRFRHKAVFDLYNGWRGPNSPTKELTRVIEKLATHPWWKVIGVQDASLDESMGAYMPIRSFVVEAYGRTPKNGLEWSRWW